MTETLSLGLIVRPLCADDVPYVARSWLMTLTERTVEGKRRRGYQRRKAYDAETPRVAAVLARSLVWCACSPDAPATIHGFLVVSHAGHVEFLFVPRALRHQGIELLLTEHAQPEATECEPESKPLSFSAPSLSPDPA